MRDLPGRGWDAWADNHLALWVDALDPFVANFEARGAKFIARCWAAAGGGGADGDDACAPGAPVAVLFELDPKNAIVIELVAPAETLTLATPTPFDDDFCASTARGGRRDRRA